VAIAGAVGLVAVTAGMYKWTPATLGVIAVMAVVSDLTSVDTGSTKMKISGSFLGIMLAAVLLGGGPAALVGVLTISLGWFRFREAPHYLRTNLATFAWFPLLSGLFFHGAVRFFHTGHSEVAFYLLVFATFVVGLAVNFFGIASLQCHLDRTSLLQKARETLLPILSAELFSALLTMIAVYLVIELGTIALALFALVLVIFQHLVGELLLSQRRSKELHRMATVDDLTGLANREHFRATVDAEIESRTASKKPFAVVLMDLDRFKEVNDTLGHDYGDMLLRELGQRFRDCVGPEGIVARLGGDEFAFFPGISTDRDEDLESFASRLLKSARQPILVDQLSLELDASVGIARFPLDGNDAHTLLRRADLAMYSAKAAQRGAAFFTPELDRNSAQRLSVLSDFRRALLRDELVVHYQPIVDLDNLVVRGAEGLVRWQHPEQGLLPPAAFIQAVEQTGLIIPLTHHVLDRAIAQCAQWRRDGSEMAVAVNLSVRNLLDRDLPKEVERLLSLHSLPPEALQLEITESMIMSDPERAIATVMRLHDLGVHLSVDDFGTGYSSLANLRQLPIDELKIDRSFVTPMLQDDNDLIIVRSTINLGHDLGLRIVAEGVEDERTLMRLATLGADLAQGYHLSKPLTPEAFTQWLGQPGILTAATARQSAGRSPAQLHAAGLQDPHLGVVAHQEAVGPGLAKVPSDGHIAPQQRGLHPASQISHG
jgi:diguanylate cyclase (GGDEF)-like protein